MIINFSILLDGSRFWIVFCFYFLTIWTRLRSFGVIWGLLRSWSRCELLSKLVFSAFFVCLFGWILLGEKILVSFLYLCRVEEDKPNLLAISLCLSLGFSFLTLIKSAIRFSLYWRDFKLASRILVLDICCKEKTLFFYIIDNV